MTDQTSLTLHSYWRSSAAWRVRIALNLKGVPYIQTTHDLRTGATQTQSYLALNPQGLVPSLDTGTEILTQSLAILEWLDERFPEPHLLPTGLGARAHVRAMAALIACDIHPLNNLRVLNHLRRDWDAREMQIENWIGHWISQGFVALEAMIARHGGDFAYGDALTMADCCLVPQVYSARRFGVDLTGYPRILAVDARCARLSVFQHAEPSHQPDADQDLRVTGCQDGIA